MSEHLPSMYRALGSIPSMEKWGAGGNTYLSDNLIEMLNVTKQNSNK